MTPETPFTSACCNRNNFRIQIRVILNVSFSGILMVSGNLPQCIQQEAHPTPNILSLWRTTKHCLHRCHNKRLKSDLTKSTQWRIYTVKFLVCAPSLGSKFFQFHEFWGKFGKILCWHPPGGLALPLRGSSGSATGTRHSGGESEPEVCGIDKVCHFTST